MAESEIIDYIISDPLELNLSYMPFITNGGLFIPSSNLYSLGDRLLIDLRLPSKKETLRIEGKVIWVTPRNALHHVLPGIGIQFIGSNAQNVRTLLEINIDPAIEIGGYVYGVTEELKNSQLNAADY